MVPDFERREIRRAVEAGAEWEEVMAAFLIRH
jgi:hypothetical protein